MDLRFVFFVLLPAAALLASAQFSHEFYRWTCPDAENIVRGVIEGKFKADPSIAPALLRMFFHDCFANGCDGSILIDPLSSQATEKESGPNLSVRGYEIIDEAKAELEKRCPLTVSCADILALATRDAVRLAGGPAYEIATGRRDSLVSNREDGDNLPGPDIPIPKLLEEFAAKGFTYEEMLVLLGGGHSFGSVKCFFLEPDVVPMDADYQTNATKQCGGRNQEDGSIFLDQTSPYVIDAQYYNNVLAKKVPLTVDRLLALDSRTSPIIQELARRPPEEFMAKFASALVKLSNVNVLVGQDGEIRRSCPDFNNPQKHVGPSIARINSLLPVDIEKASQNKAADDGTRPKPAQGGSQQKQAHDGAQPKAAQDVAQQKPAQGGEQKNAAHERVETRHSSARHGRHRRTRGTQ